jgi:type IV secretory pathway VirB10-like protein
MSFRRRRSATFPWQSVGLFVGGTIIGAIVLVLVLGDPLGPGAEAADPTPPATEVASAGQGGFPTIEPTPAPPEGQAPGDEPGGAPAETPTQAPDATAPVMPPLPTAAPPSPTPEPSPTVPTREQIEAAVTEAVERFQEAKEESQRTGDTSGLSAVLAKSALQRQIDLVNATRADGCYWEISLDEPMRVTITELRDNNYARVTVFKTETRIKYCNGALESSVTGDAYETYNTVELIDGRWYVTERE